MDPVCSIQNLLLSVERLCWDMIAWPNQELLIFKQDYDTRIDELRQAKSAILWNFSEITRSHHWSAELTVGATTYQDYGNKKLLRLTDEAKFMLDSNPLIPVYNYTDDMSDTVINKLVVAAPIKWLPVITESNNFKTSLLVCTVRYAQSNYQ